MNKEIREEDLKELFEIANKFDIDEFNRHKPEGEYTDLTTKEIHEES